MHYGSDNCSEEECGGSGKMNTNTKHPGRSRPQKASKASRAKQASADRTVAAASTRKRGLAEISVDETLDNDDERVSAKTASNKMSVHCDELSSRDVKVVNKGLKYFSSLFRPSIGEGMAVVLF